MDKKPRLILLGALALLGIALLAWVLWPAPAPTVDPVIVNAAAESARAAAAKEPPAPDAPVVKGRARPGSLGNSTP